MRGHCVIVYPVTYQLNTTLSSPPSPGVAYPPSSLYLHKSLLCAFQPPPVGHMHGQFSHSHWATFSQPSASRSSSFLALGPGRSAPRCGAGGEQQVHGCVSGGQANSLTYVLSFDRRFSKSRYVRAKPMLLCQRESVMHVCRWLK